MKLIIHLVNSSSIQLSKEGIQAKGVPAVFIAAGVALAVFFVSFA